MYDLKDDRWLKNLGQLRSVDKKVVLTFDDGPSRILQEILDVLREKDVQAVFFWQSSLLHEKRPWQRVIEEGHKIGSHAHDHKNLTALSQTQQRHQITKSVNKIKEFTGTNVSYFRPPFGQYNEKTMGILNELDLVPVMWEISSYDWENKNNPETISKNVVEYVRDGSVILLHELEQTLSILPQLIDEIKEKGFGFTLI